MKEVIDIYAKILIATFSFIAPSMTFFLGIFAKGTARLKRENEEKIKVFELLILHPSEGTNTSDQIKEKEKNIKLYKKANRAAKTDINLVNPKRQSIRIFSLLLLSGVSLACYFLLRSPYFNIYELFQYKLLVLLLSACFFIRAIFAIGQVFFLMIRIKQKEYDDEVTKTTEILIQREQ